MKQSAITNAVHHSHNSDIKTFLDLPGREENKKKLETIQREVDLPLPVARFHDLFNGPYLLVARCFICTRIFFSLVCLPRIALSLEDDDCFLRLL